MEIEKEELKKLICDSIDMADKSDIKYYIKDHMYTAISEYGAVVYKPSGRKELSIKIIVDNQ
jgi:LEA14-like dessication related protein